MQPTRRLLVVIPLIAIAAVVLLRCGRVVDDGDRWTTISESVIDSLSGAPLDSALMTVDDTISPLMSVYSNAQGEYSVSPMGLREFRVYCTKAGYSTSLRVVISDKNRFRFTDVDFKLVKN